MMNPTNELIDNDPQLSLLSSQVNSIPTTPSYLVHTLDYFVNSGTTICKLLKEQICVDLTFSSRGRCFQIHKIILISCSEYFMEELPKNPETGTIVVNWMDDDILWPFIEYMYCGKTIVDSRLIGLFIQTCKYFRIHGISSLEINSNNENIFKSNEKYKFTPPMFLNKHQIKEINTTVTIADKKLPTATFNDSSTSARKRGRPRLNEVNNDAGYINMNMDIAGSSQSFDQKPINLNDFLRSDMNDSSMVEISLSDITNFSNSNINQNNNIQIANNVEPNMFFKIPKTEVFDDEEECGQAVQNLMSVDEIITLDNDFDTTEQCTFLNDSGVDSGKENTTNDHDMIFLDDKNLDFQTPSFGNALRSAKAGESLLSQAVSTRYDENPLTELDQIQNDSKNSKRRRGRPRKSQSTMDFNQTPQLITYYDIAK